MTGRSVDTWEGATPDTPIPSRVKLRIFQRQNGRCAITGIKLGPGTPYAFDHIIPLSQNGKNSEDNLQCISTTAHAEKTKVDVKTTAKLKRMALKNAGLWPKSKASLKSRGFAKTRPSLAETD